jgi:hypothetical protein
VGWNNTASARNDIQRNLNCCGFRSFNPNDTCLAVSPKCKGVVFIFEMCYIQMNNDKHGRNGLSDTELYFQIVLHMLSYNFIDIIVIFACSQIPLER